jgi:hypothetical protein
LAVMESAPIVLQFPLKSQPAGDFIDDVGAGLGAREHLTIPHRLIIKEGNPQCSLQT